MNRIVKDYKYYQAEVEKQTAKVEKFKADGEDEGKIRQYEESLAETIAMLPNCKAKIQPARDDLQAHIDMVGEEEEFRQSEDFGKA